MDLQRRALIASREGAGVHSHYHLLRTRTRLQTTSARTERYPGSCALVDLPEQVFLPRCADLQGLTGLLTNFHTLEVEAGWRDLEICHVGIDNLNRLGGLNRGSRCR